MSQLRVNNISSVGGVLPTYSPGSIIQTKYVQYGTSTTYSTSSWTTLLTLNITPQKTSSVIIVGFSFHVSGRGGFGIQRNGSTIWGTVPSDGSGPYMYYQDPTNQTIATSSSTRQLASFNYFDAPTTTSSTTYSLIVRPYGTAGSTQFAVCEGNNVGTFFVMEVAQ